MKAFLLLLLFAAGLRAEDIYVAQNALGGEMSSAATATNLAWFNNSANWGSGASKISAGDTVHFVGTFTNVATFQAGGTAGNWITNYWEPGCKFILSAGICQVALNLLSRDYICVDGGPIGNEGSIAWTDNGTALAYQFSTVGVNSVNPPAGNIVIKNLRMTNLFVFTKETPALVQSSGVQMEKAGTNITVQNVIGHRMEKVAYLTYGSEKANGNWNILQCRAQYVSWGFAGGDASSGAIVDGINLVSNRVDGLSEFENSDGGYHLNGFYFWAELGGFTTGSYITNLSAYDNDFGPDLGASDNTAGMFLSASGGRGVYATKLYNNLLYTDAGIGEGLVLLWRCFGGAFVGNTLRSWGGGNGFRTLNSTNIGITNNIFRSCGFAVQSKYNGAGAFPELSGADYNMYSLNADSFGDTGVTWANWHANYFDAHSTTNLLPAFVNLAGNDYHLSSSSQAIGIATNSIVLSAYDKDGVPRGALWDMGACEYVAPVTNAARAPITLTGPQVWSGRVTFSQ